MTKTFPEFLDLRDLGIQLVETKLGMVDHNSVETFNQFGWLLEFQAILRTG